MKRLCTILLAIIMVLSITGCSPADSGSGTTAPANGGDSAPKDSAPQDAASDSKSGGEFDWSDITIGFTGYDNSTEYLVTIENTLRESIEARGGTFLSTMCNGDGQTIRSTQESYILQGADLLIDYNFLTEMFDGGYSQELEDKGMPVISIDVLYQEPAYYYGANMWDQGASCADAAVNFIKNEWGGECDAMVVMYLGINGESGNARSYGAEARFKEAFPDVETIWMDMTTGGGDMNALAYTYASDYMTAHPDQKHVYFQIHSDSQAVAAYSAIEQAGATDRCIICSVDGQTEAVKTIKENEGKCWIATVAAHPERYGEGVADYIEEILTDSSTPRQRYTEAVYVTYDNIYEHFPN